MAKVEEEAMDEPIFGKVEAQDSIDELLSRRVAQCSPTRSEAPSAVALPSESDSDEVVVEHVALPDRMASAGDPASFQEDTSRRITGAAATIGGTVGMLLAGPVSGAALGVAAAYASTREDNAGKAARMAGAVYLKVSDQATDAYVKIVDRAVDEGRRKLSEELRSVDPSVPGPLRNGLRRLSESLQPTTRNVVESCKEEARRMRKQYPDRVPIICERSPYVDLPRIDRKKFAVPGTMLCGEFKYIVHKHVAQALGSKLRAEQTIYIFVKGISPKTSAPMSELYEQFCAADGFLYVTYGVENTLG
mmetsp:Transcript_122447/g.346193  ORF Transcript_122447/g.346193 Transcript_122447/m.346193 type:complete len:305 (-) Transcript_122447:88-1002(-)